MEPCLFEIYRLVCSCIIYNTQLVQWLHNLFTVPALEFFTVTESDTDEARLVFTWRIKYDGGHAISDFTIQYRDVQDTSEGKS